MVIGRNCLIAFVEAVFRKITASDLVYKFKGRLF